MTHRPASPFFAGVWVGLAPLLVWALHFAACYVAVAAACASPASPSPDLPLLRTCLIAATAVALVTLLAMLLRAGALHPGGRFDLMIRRVCAALALIGVAWSVVPVALLTTCTA